MSETTYLTTINDAPVAAARRWIEAVQRRDGFVRALEEAWPLTDPGWRDLLVESLPGVAARFRPLIAEAPWRSNAWPNLFASRIHLSLLDAIGDEYVPTWVADQYEWAIGVDLEAVAFGPAYGASTGLCLAMHWTAEQWLVTGVWRPAAS